MTAAVQLPSYVALSAVIAATITGQLAAGLHSRHQRHQRNRSGRQLAHKGTTAMASEEEMRSPDWCWTHGCHRSACPTPQH